MKKSGSNNKRSLTLESLESRSMMAGNVTASVVNGSLIVEGDAQANGLVVEQTVPGTFRVRTYSLGGSDTLLNGSTNNVQSFSGVTADAIFRLHGERDELRMQAANGGQARIPGNLRIEAGDEGDPVNLRVRVGEPDRGGHLSVRAGNVAMNNSWIRQTATIRGGGAQLLYVLVDKELLISGSQGNDRITIDGGRAQSLKIFAGEGDDFIRVAAKMRVTGRVQILADTQLLESHGNDHVLIGSLTADSLRVNVYSGSNRVSMYGDSNISDVRMFCGEDTDEMKIDGLQSEVLVAFLYAGNDSLIISNTTSTKATLHGGDGTDDLVLGNGNSIGAIVQTGFE